MEVGAPDVFTLPPVSPGLFVIAQLPGAKKPVKSACIPDGVVPFKLVPAPRQIVEGVAVTGDGDDGGALTVITLLEEITQP